MKGQQFVKCLILDANMRRRYDNGVAMLPLSEAKKLANLGLVKISQTVNDAVEKSNNNYLHRVSFSKGKLKIAWVQDNSKIGGAEISNTVVVNAGERLGYSIVGVTPSTWNVDILFDADLIIINNCFEFTTEQYRELLKILYDNKIPYIKYDHDYRELKRINQACQLFGMARRVIYISPPHKTTMENALMLDNGLALPLAIEGFNNTPNIERKRGTVLIPTLRKGKSIMSAWINAHPDYEYTIIGGGDINNIKTTNVRGTGYVDIAGMEKLYRQHEFMLHMPEEPWAGERIYFEAILCGCVPIVNMNVGHSHWNIANKDIHAFLQKAIYDFWKEIEKCQ